MKNLLILDNSAVSDAIRKGLKDLGTSKTCTLQKASLLTSGTFNSIVISSHSFAYDNEMSEEDVLNMYKADVIAFDKVLSKSPDLLPDGGKIVVILSMDGLQSSFASKHYSAIHAARKSLIQSYGNVLASRNISINGIALGWIDDVLDAGDDENTAAIKETARKYNPFKRLGQPDEVAELVRTLLQLNTGFLNGHVVNFDGGQVNVNPVTQLEWEQRG